MTWVETARGLKIDQQPKHRTHKDNGQPDPVPKVLTAERKPLLPVSIGQIMADYPKLKEPIVHGILRRGEVANIIAAPKVGKSWLSYGLALSVATGSDWLDTFPTEQGRVLIVDNELHPETIAQRIPAVANALMIPKERYRNSIDVLCLRGRLMNYTELGGLVIDYLSDSEYQMVLVDAHYRLLGSVSENENGAMAEIYNWIDQFAEQTQAAWVLIHHLSKGNQSQKSITDCGSGAGSQSRAADSHIVLREHEKPDHVVLDVALRSFAPVEPLVLKWNFPLWVPSDANPDMLKGRLTRNEERQQERDRQGMSDLINVLDNWDQQADGPATPNRICDKSPSGKDKTRRLLSMLLHNGTVTRQPVTVRGNLTHEYTLSNQ